jgi:NAD(P)-dependent dehydrogenase (short-subunit alcohol dehydrogenase family)
VWQARTDDWWRAVEVNLGGAFVLAQLALAHMIAAGRGRIINITSYAGVYRWPLMSAYAASKAALVKLTETMAEETRPHGVSVFSVDPGLLPFGLGGAALRSGADRQTPEAASRAGFATSSPPAVAPTRRTPLAWSSRWPAAARTGFRAAISASPRTLTPCSAGSTRSSATTCTRCGCERGADAAGSGGGEAPPGAAVPPGYQRPGRAPPSSAR